MKKYFKSNLYFLTIFFLILASLQQLFAQTVATADLRSLLLLHPEMLNYNPSKRAFKTDITDKHKAEIEKLQQNSALMLADHKITLQTLSDSLAKLDKEYSRKVESINKTYRNMSEEAERHKDEGKAEAAVFLRKRELYAADAERGAKARALEVQYTMTAEKIEKLQSSVYNVGYTEPSVTAERFRIIEKEVLDAIRKVADRKGAKIVLNAAYFRSPLKAFGNETADFFGWERSELENPYRDVFYSPFPTAIREDKSAIAGYYSSIISKAKIWLDNSDTVFMNFDKSLTGRDVILGGEDITEEALLILYAQYKMDMNIGKSVAKALFEKH